MSSLPKTLSAPERPNSLPEHAKWLAGEGAGSWFVLNSENQVIEISRYSPSGDFECGGTFKTDQQFDSRRDYQITFPSHCAKVTLLQNGNRITFLAC